MALGRNVSDIVYQVQTNDDRLALVNKTAEEKRELALAKQRAEQAQIYYARLQLSFEERYQFALRRIEEILAESSFQDDPFNLGELITNFRGEAEIEKTATNNNPERLKKLVEDVEVISDQLRVITAPQLDYEALDRNHQRIQAQAASMEDPSGRIDRFKVGVFTIGSALLSVALTITFSVCAVGLSISPLILLPILFASFISILFVAAGAGAIEEDEKKQESLKTNKTNLTKNMLLFGDVVKDKASEKQPSKDRIAPRHVT